ncbi:histidine kinase [Hymenobacter seoulensis]
MLGDIFLFSLYAFIFYIHSEWLFPQFFIPKRFGVYTIGVISVFLTYLAVRGGLIQFVIPSLGIKSTQTFVNLRIFLAVGVFRGVYFYACSLVYAAVKYALRTQYQLRIQERGLLEADIAFLKSQINPHFLFNALNFLYAQVYPLSEPTAKSVLLLSDIMRYALNEGGEQGKVMLDKELQHLRNYVALNQLRFGHQLQVQLQVQGSTQFLLILPLVLITFVENCFKHGELFDPAHPVLVQVRVQENQLTFFTSNRKHGGPVEHSTGIGLDNTRRRLAAFYPGRHQLTVHDTPDAYATHLTLSL